LSLPGGRDSRRAALGALVIVAPAPAIGAWVALWQEPGPVGLVAYGLGKFVLYGVPLAWLMLVEGRRPSWSPPREGGLGAGVLLGIVFAVGIWALHLAGASEGIDPAGLRAAAVANGFATPGRFVIVCAYMCVVNAALEEYAFRWFLFSRCRTLLGGGAAVLAAGLLFTAHHVIVLRAYFDWPLALACSLAVLLAGISWSALYLRYGSVWPGYLSHLLVDAAVMSVGYQILFGG